MGSFKYRVAERGGCDTKQLIFYKQICKNITELNRVLWAFLRKSCAWWFNIPHITLFSGKLNFSSNKLKSFKHFPTLFNCVYEFSLPAIYSYFNSCKKFTIAMKFSCYWCLLQDVQYEVSSIYIDTQKNAITLGSTVKYQK